MHLSHGENVTIMYFVFEVQGVFVFEAIKWQNG